MTRFFQSALPARQTHLPSWFALLVASFLPFLLIQSANAQSLPDFTGLVEENSAAVVNISTVSEPDPRTQRSPFSERELEQMPEFFRHFFGGPQSPFGGGSSQPRRSMGSGFIVSEDGYVLTNNHVIEGADEVMVRLNDRRELQARVVGTDPRSDMAVLKIEDDEPLPVVRIGRSSELKPGQWVFAIGSPFGFDYTVTSGIVSATGRSLPSENYVPFIQTDVAINPGNSGGPLFNLDGEVVGINSQIYTRSGGFMGVSFAIPIDDAMNVFRQLRDEGSVARGWLGVLIQEVNRDLAESFGLSRPRGALVAEVMPDSPAAKAGLQAGDIVLAYEGEDIERSADLPPKVGRTPVGDEVALTVLRQGKERTVEVEIGRLPEEEDASAAPGAPSGPANGPLGMRVEPLPDQLANRLDIPGGVVVTEVGRGPAFQAGIRRNDVITELNRQTINNVEDFREAVSNLPSDRAVSVRIIREGRATYLVMKP
ncbi:DegQ family serine endoprotease [Marinobacter sp.]|uniref:DegQ family serine endoprotease n=1 Tax=Marinobacter sp. TaxID=50741 RepID=UPI003566DA8D